MDHLLSFQQILSETQGWLTFALILLASLVGSLHCAGMCGPLAVCASKKSLLATLLYHVGRLLGYMVVGGLFGLLGSKLLGGAFKYVNLISTFLVAAAFFLFSYQLIFKGGISAQLPKAMNSFLTKVMAITRGNSGLFSFSLGLLTPLLPCGWFYGFALVAMTTESALQGALLMLAFWMGTVPILVVMSEAVRLGLGKFQPKLRAATGALFFCLGVFTLMNKYEHLGHMNHGTQSPEMQMDHQMDSHKHHHKHH